MQQHEQPALSAPACYDGWQFQLKHLFGLTTISAIAAALAANYGAGTLLASAGMLLAWLNMCGAFQSYQNERRQAVLLWLAWATFLVSLGLPSIKVFGPVYGASAAWFALGIPAETVLKREPIPLAVIVYLVIDIANLLMLALPVIIWRLRRGRGQWLIAALCIVMVSPWCVGWNADGLLIGYFIWCMSFWLALIAIRVRIQTLGTMLVVAIALAATVLRWS